MVRESLPCMLETTARRASVGEVERRRFGAGAGAGGAESLLEAADEEAHIVPVGIAQPGAMWTSIFFFFCGRSQNTEYTALVSSPSLAVLHLPT